VERHALEDAAGDPDRAGHDPWHHLVKVLVAQLAEQRIQIFAK
jgi:hypothetical protein